MCPCGRESRYASGGPCGRCYQREWREKKAEAIRERKRSYYLKNRRRVLDQNKATILRTKPAGYYTNASWVRRLKAIGLTPVDYQAMLDAQGGACAICRSKSNGKFKVFAVDHCHETNVVRGLLCSKCNRGIGLLRDSPEMLIAAAAYLSKPRLRAAG